MAVHLRQTMSFRSIFAEREWNELRGGAVGAQNAPRTADNEWDALLEHYREGWIQAVSATPLSASYRLRYP